jgi:hypothetical protein
MMVEFDLAGALVGGFVASVVMTALMTMARQAGMTDMPPMPLVIGSMLSGNRARAMSMGAIAHLVVMGTVVFGIVYGLLFSAFDSDAWWVGTLIGVAHGLIVGVVFMPMMPAMHPRMPGELVAAGTAPAPGTVATDDRGGLRIAAPGMLGRNWGGMTPVGLVMGHAVYGLVLALVYTAIT